MFRIKAIFSWYDFWVGLFWDRAKKILYFFPVPMFGIKINCKKEKKAP